MTYVIGDVHGNYNTLNDLIKHTSKNDTLIFVGDLIDRGKYSRQTVRLARQNGYKCILGNHETMMIESLHTFLNDYPTNFRFSDLYFWLECGGRETLLSYELIRIENNDIVFNENNKYFDDFISDLYWMKTLPLYLELEHKINDKRVVISHSCISNVWDKKDDENYKDMLEEHVLWDRQTPHENSNIFNVYGHTKVNNVIVKENYAAIDTGCFSRNKRFGKLSAFCLEDQKIISVFRNLND